MKKKNLIILLLIPFIISLLGVVAINVTVSFIAADITGIKWDYDEVEGFKVGNEYRLYAVGEAPEGVTIGEGNDLIWSLSNKDANDTNEYAKIYLAENGYYYLQALKVGEIILTCSNEKGNVFRSLSAMIYESGAILLSSKDSTSQNNIDSTIYYGEYQDVNKMQKLSIDLNIKVESDDKNIDLSSSLAVLECSDNIEVDIMGQKVKIKDGYQFKGNEHAYFSIGFPLDESTIPAKYEFMIVKDGINVDSYDELLACTNNSNDAEIVVL